jgi:hypothetical protein
MCSGDRDTILEDFATLRATVSRILGHSYEALTTPERLNLQELLETEKRRLPVVEHQLINQTAEQSNAQELGGKLSHVLADRLRITRADASRRVAEAAELGPAPRAERGAVAAAAARDRDRAARRPDRRRPPLRQ